MLNVNQMELFKEKALGTDNQFTIENGSWVHMFTKIQVGSAQYIYTHEYYNRGISLRSEFKLFAIVSEGVIYTYGSFYLRQDEELPIGVMELHDKHREHNRELNELFTSYYEAIPVGELTEENLESAKRNVREYILNGKYETSTDIISSIDMEDSANILNGSLELTEVIKRDLEKNTESYSKRKAFDKEYKRLIALQHNVSDDELRAYKALNELEAKTVTVEFNFNGKVDSEKMELDRIKRLIMTRDYFDTYDFVTRVAGEALLKERLGADTWRGEDRNTVEFHHVSKIKYGKKVVYQI